MPYKDPERKRQWEQEHREQRNAKRRMQAQAERSGRLSMPKPAHDPAYVAQQAIFLARIRKSTSGQVEPPKQTSGWKVLLGFMVGAEFLILAAVSGFKFPPPGGLGGLPRSDGS